MKPKDQCTICETEKECIHSNFGVGNMNANPVAISDYMLNSGRINFDRTLTLPVCDACAREKGKGPYKLWITLIVAAIVYAVLVLLRQPGTNELMTIQLVLVFASAIVQVVVGMILLSKAGLSMGKTILLGIIQMIPFAGFPLLLYKRRIDQNTQAIKALMPIAKERFMQTDQREAELKQKVESGEVTDKDLVREFKRNEARKQAQQEAHVQKARSGKIFYALFGIAFTAYIILQGYGVYSSNSGYMTLFGNIKLTPVTFTVVIAVFLVYDVFSLINAFRKHR